LITDGQSSRHPQAFEAAASDGTRKQGRRLRLISGAFFVAVLVIVFWRPMAALAVHAFNSELHSYVLLIPFISAFLIHLQRGRLPREFRSSPGWGMALFLAGFAALFLAWGHQGGRLSHNDQISLVAFSAVCFLVGGGFLFLGRTWMGAAAFPVAFLFFMVPLPDAVVHCLETASKLASAEVAAVFFQLSGTPALRDGTVFQLPGIVIEVAQECSGIRSSLVLFITGLLTSYLLLKSPWRRALLVGVVIPLGILRNGLRILVISLLCVEVGPQMIHSAIHRRGGPYFFALSLIPLFLLLWWLRRGEEAVRDSNGSGRGQRQ
jgi:exosortase C (VPDSG-CTERM-specific)